MDQSTPAVNPESDGGLAQVLEQYLAALEAGTAPDREAFLAAHPHLAGELRECLASLELIRVAAHGPLALDEGAAAGLDQPLGRLGDFEIVRPSRRQVGRRRQSVCCVEFRSSARTISGSTLSLPIC